MGLIDFILNIVGLLLWLNWRSQRFDPLHKTSPATLVGTLRRAEAPRLQGWKLPIALVALLILRALVYWMLGFPTDWTPKLDLGIVVVALRSDVFQSAFLFSVLSFARVMIVFYFWLLILTIVNRSTTDAASIQRFVQLHLGRLSRWPWPIRGLLPILCVAGMWLALHPLLLHLNATDRVRSTIHLLEQGGLVGLCLLFTLKYVLPVFLFH